MTDYTLTAAPGALAFAGAASARVYGSVITDNLTAGENPTVVFPLSLSQAMTVAPAQTLAFRPAATINETILVAASPSETTIYGLTMAEIARFMDALSITAKVVVTAGMTVSEALRATLGVTVLERLLGSDALAVAASYNMTLADLIQINSGLNRWLGGAFSDVVTLNATLGLHYFTSASAQDGIVLSSVLGNTFLMSIALADGIELDDAQILHMVFNQQLTDGLVINAGYVEPNGSFTTWAINTRTNAVTEYQNWAFNSFARMGRKYLGANRDGLYELDGVSDDGASIPTYIASGLFAPGGSRFSAFKAVYLGMRVDSSAGDFFFKIVTGDDKEYTYSVTPKDMRSTRVNLGKGLRSRYYRWALSSTAADYDLESITFIPMTMQRRV